MTLYEWLSTALGLVTALATSIGALLAWRMHQAGPDFEVRIDWTRAGAGGTAYGLLIIAVRNSSRGSLSLGSVEVVYPPMIRVGKADKHESWGANKAPLGSHQPLAPGAAEEFRLAFHPDWEAWAASEERSLRLRWRRLTRRRFRPAYSIIRLYAKDVSSISLHKRHTHKVMVSAEMVISEAAASRIKA